MKKYISIIRLKFINGLQYRAAAYGGIATQFFWGFMRILMFLSFYNAKPENFPMKFEQLSSYIWLQQSFLVLFTVLYSGDDIFDIILNGNISYELCRPIKLYNMWFSKNAGGRLSKVALRCIPILVIAFILPKPYSLGLPYNIYFLIISIISMILGFLIAVSFIMLMYISAFFTISPKGIRVITASLIEFLSGMIIPLPFLPDKIRVVIEALPFASMQNIPFRIYSGNISGTQIIYSILLQIFWLCMLIIIGKLFMAKALKRVVVQGG